MKAPKEHPFRQIIVINWPPRDAARSFVGSIPTLASKPKQLLLCGL